MSTNISAQELFTSGLTREQFIQKYSELRANQTNGDSSIFTDDFANSLGEIFDTLNVNGNDTLDEDEITALQGFGDDDNTTLSEADLKALYEKMGESIMNKYSSSSTPEEMYNQAMAANGDVYSNTYIEDLNQQIAVLQELISLRTFNATNIQQTYQSQIDELIKKDTSISNDLKTEYIKLSEKVKSLQKESDKNASELTKTKAKMDENETAISVTQKEIDSLDPDNEDDANSINVWQQDLNRLLSEKDDLDLVYTNLTKKQKSITQDLATNKKALEDKGDEIASDNPEIKSKIAQYKSLISQEETQSKKDIESYNNEITTLKAAQEYAIQQMAKTPAVSSTDSSEGSHKNDNATSFDELNEMGLEYSGENGQKLASSVKKHAKGFTGYCSRYVSNALAESGLGTERAGAAADMDTKLENNPNFKEIKVSSAEDLKKLPAGCILVYERGAARYNSKYGHIEVTLGDGTAGSDGITRNIRYSDNMSVFVPVKKSA